MTIDERLDRLMERHEGLSQTLDVLTHDINTLRATVDEQSQLMQQHAAEIARRRAEAAQHMLPIIAAIRSYLDAMTGGTDDQ